MKRLTFLFALLAAALAATPAQALKISPFKAVLTPDGSSSSSQVFRIENNSSEPAAVQVSVTTWEIEKDGTEVNRDAEDDFVIFPAQVVLSPHESRAVRVQWLGEPKPGVEKTYRLLAEQLPVNLKDTPGSGSAVRFMLRFRAALYISPAGGKSDIVVSSFQPSPAGTLRVTLENKGTVHNLLRDPVLHLNLSDGKSMQLSGADLKPMEGENIHARKTRDFEIPLPAGTAEKVSAVRLDSKPGL